MTSSQDNNKVSDCESYITSKKELFFWKNKNLIVFIDWFC